MQTHTSSSARALFVLGLFASLSAASCAAGGGSDALAASDALHADLATCPDGTSVGAACDGSLADCATAVDFAVACGCEAAADGTARVRCDEPLPVPALRICADDVVAGGRCDGSATDESACVLPSGARCVCREATTDPSVPPTAAYAWACEVPSPGPVLCDATVAAGDDCTGREGATCDLDRSTHCTCSSTGRRDGALWLCATDATVPPCASVADGTCAAAPTCTLDDGRVCSCIDDGSADTSPRYECGPPPPPPVAYCPREVFPGSPARIECDAIGASCTTGDPGSTTSDSCLCIEDSLRDPSRPVGVWACPSVTTPRSDA